MQLKSHWHSKTLKEINEEINFNEDFFKKVTPEQVDNYVYQEEINTLKYVLEELERENIDIEQDCF